MAYTIKDILKKLIEFEKGMAEAYSKLHMNTKTFDALKILAKVMAKEEERHALYFEKIKNSLSEEKNIEIDFFLYDKVSELMYSFKNNIEVPEVKNITELLKFMINLEENNIGLLIDIRGRLIQKKEDASSENYKILTSLIEEEETHIKNLKNLIG